MSGLLLDPISVAEREAAEAEARRRALDQLVYGLRRQWEVWCFAPSSAFLARAVVLSIRNDRLGAELARRARKPSPATSSPGDRPTAPTERRPGARRRRRRRR